MENFRTLEFTAPSGENYTIREQNGEDEEIISNAFDAKTLMNINKFIAAIVVNTTLSNNGRLTPDQVLSMPSLDKYCILFKSRIFSLGSTVEFTYPWESGPIEYEQDLTEMLFDDYGESPTEEELEAKPNALPYYPEAPIKGRKFQLSSGRVIAWDYMNGRGESYLLNLPLDKQTRNSDLIARNLQLEVDGKLEKVQNFKLFSPKDMKEIREHITSLDPIFSGLTDIEHPVTGEKAKYAILGAPTFFFLTEA